LVLVEAANAEDCSNLESGCKIELLLHPL